MKKNKVYMIFSVVFFVATIGMIGWIVKQEIDAGVQEKQFVLSEEKKEDEKKISAGDVQKQEDLRVPIETKAEADQALGDMDELMKTMNNDSVSM